MTPSSSAASAGLQGTQRDRAGHIRLGDVILAIDGKEVNRGKDVFAILDRHNVGDVITLTILRNDERQEVKVTLQAAE